MSNKTGPISEGQRVKMDRDDIYGTNAGTRQQKLYAGALATIADVPTDGAANAADNAAAINAILTRMRAMGVIAE